MAEAWLSGPVPGIPSLLVPVAHSLIQVRDDIPPILQGLTPEQLWARPGGSAAIGYHAVHLAGALSRLFTYARDDILNDAQQAELKLELRIHDERPDANRVTNILEAALAEALASLPSFGEDALLAPREVGKRRLPSNVFGLLFHAAEHSTRHAGQIQTLIRVIRGAGD